MGFQMAGSWGGYRFLAIFCVLCIILTNPFSWGFFEVLPRGVFKDIFVSHLKNFLELPKFQKCGILNFILCFYKVSESIIYLWREYQNEKITICLRFCKEIMFQVSCDHAICFCKYLWSWRSVYKLIMALSLL